MERPVTLAALRAACEGTNELRVLWKLLLLRARDYYVALGNVLIDMADAGRIRASTVSVNREVKDEFETACRTLFAKMDRASVPHPTAINIFALIALMNDLKLPAAE